MLTLTQKIGLVTALMFGGTTPAVVAFTPCPLIGPAYPPPVDFSSNSSALPQAWNNLTSTLKTLIERNNNSQGFDWKTHSFSIGAFSLNDIDAQKHLQYHSTGSLVANSSLGTNKIDENSIYRVASISKLITTYLALVELGTVSWSTPVTRYLPELAQVNRTVVPGTRTEWENITVGALAGHMSGIGRDIPYFITDFAVGDRLAGVDPVPAGWPPLNFSNTADYPSCIIFQNASCPESEELHQIAEHSPVYLPWQAPSYSNMGFMLLGAVVERAKNKSYADAVHEGVFGPLGMNSSSSTTPVNWSTGNTVIPGSDPESELWGHDLGIEAAAEGIYSTLADLNKLGLSILNSTLLDPVETRQWMKPIAETANLRQSVGRPWEIYRITQPVTGRISDLYTKVGNFRNYSSLLALSADHSAGFTVLTAGPSAYAALSAIEDLVGEAVVPAFEAQAAIEAKTNYAGTFKSRDTSLNSSMTIDIDTNSGPGLVITAWVSNGTDMMKSVGAVFGGIKELDARMYPTDTGLPSLQVFRAVYGIKSGAQPTGMFSAIDACESWQLLDTIQYGQTGIDEMIFGIDENGRATSVRPSALRVTLYRAD